MELRQIQYVVTVVDEGGFTAAADALGVAQPSLSQGIRALERDLGVSLFRRVGRRAVLSAAGEQFVEPARRVLRDVRTARAAAEAVAGLESGHLDLASLPTLAVDPLAHLVGAFRTAYPGVAVKVIEPEAGHEVDDLVRDGRTELGLTDLLGSSGLESIRLDDQDILVVCPPTTRLEGGRFRAARLDGVPLVMTPSGTSMRRLVEAALAEADIDLTIAVEIAQREALLPLVLAGAGTSFLPRPQAEQAAAAGAVVAPLDPPLRRSIGLVHREGTLSPAARAFVDLAVKGRRTTRRRAARS